MVNWGNNESKILSKQGKSLGKDSEVRRNMLFDVKGEGQCGRAYYASKADETVTIVIIIISHVEKLSRRQTEQRSNLLKATQLHSGREWIWM